MGSLQVCVERCVERIDFFVSVFLLILLTCHFSKEIQLNLKPMFDLEGENGYKLHRELNSYSAWSPNSTVSLEHLKEKQDCYGHLLCKCTHIRIEKNINAKTLVRNQRNNIALLHAKLPKRRIILCNDMSNSALIKIQKSIQNDLNVTESMKTKQEIINPLAGGGIAAAAALAAQRIQNKQDDELSDDKPKASFNPLAGGGIAAAAALAAQRIQKKKDDDDDKPKASFNPLAGGGIAAAAALATQRIQNKQDDDPIDDKPKASFNPLAGGA